MNFFIGLLLFYFLSRFKSNVIYYGNPYIILIINFLTTSLHEIMHYLIALILGGRPTGFSLIPKKRKIGNLVYWEFGSVVAYTNRFNAFFIGIAPILNIVVAYFIWKYYFFYIKPNILSILFFYFVEWVLINNGIPSKQDLKVALKGYIGWIFSISIFVFLFFLK